MKALENWKFPNFHVCTRLWKLQLPVWPLSVSALAGPAHRAECLHGRRQGWLCTLLFCLVPGAASSAAALSSGASAWWSHSSGHCWSADSCCGCSGAQSYLTLCDPVDCSTPGFPVLHHLLEFTQTHVHWVGDAIQPSHPLSPHSPPAFSLSQHQGLFQLFASGGQSIGASASASVLPVNIKGWFPLGWTSLISLKSMGPSNPQEYSLTPQFESINSLAVSLLYGPALTSVHDYWKNHSFNYIDLCQQRYVSDLMCCLGSSQLSFQGENIL